MKQNVLKGAAVVNPDKYVCFPDAAVGVAEVGVEEEQSWRD